MNDAVWLLRVLSRYARIALLDYVLIGLLTSAIWEAIRFDVCHVNWAWDKCADMWLHIEIIGAGLFWPVFWYLALTGRLG